MDLEPLTPPADRPHIRSYGPGGFLISGVRWRGAVLVRAEGVTTVAAPGPEALTPALLESLALDGLDLLLLGTGTHFVAPSAALRAALRHRGIALEAMTTAAACRTFNLLLAEDRRVAALLLPPGGDER